MTRKNYQFGFTLVELLVVITIIALLTTMGMIGYTNATRKSRDGRRQADLEQIRTALELYRSDNSAYPDDWADLVTEEYIREIPEDPKGFSYVYVPDTDNLGYDLCAHLETGDTTDDCGGAEACGDECNYRVQSP